MSVIPPAGIVAGLLVLAETPVEPLGEHGVVIGVLIEPLPCVGTCGGGPTVPGLPATGAELPWAALLLAAVLVAIGLALLLRRASTRVAVSTPDASTLYAGVSVDAQIAPARVGGAGPRSRPRDVRERSEH